MGLLRGWTFLGFSEVTVMILRKITIQSLLGPCFFQTFLRFFLGYFLLTRFGTTAGFSRIGVARLGDAMLLLDILSIFEDLVNVLCLD